MREVRHRHRAVYDANARRFDAGRGRRLVEKPWLDLLLERVPPGGAVLDLGCGAGEPVAAYLAERGCAVTGLDFSPAMLALARARLPAARWIEGDMRRLAIGQRFAGIVAWDSFFHLAADEQRALIPRLASHIAPGGGLLLTVGPHAGEALGRVGDDTVYHASLSEQEYRERLAAVGLEVERFVAEDPQTGGHSVLFAAANPGRMTGPGEEPGG